MHLGLPVICIVKTAENDVVSGNSGRTLHALTHRHHPHDYTPSCSSTKNNNRHINLSSHVLTLDTYGGEDTGSWVLLEEQE